MSAKFPRGGGYGHLADSLISPANLWHILGEPGFGVQAKSLDHEKVDHCDLHCIRAKASLS